MKKLQYHVTVESPQGEIVTFGPDDNLPAWAAKKITNPSAWEGEGDDDDDADGGTDPDAPVPYAKQSVEDLKAEVEKRNEGRDEDDHVVVEGKGNKPDLVAALEADDAAQSQD